jgi:serine/threonine-protein kinase
LWQVFSLIGVLFFPVFLHFTTLGRGKSVDTNVKKIGKYEILGILGRGGMGVVYRAEDKRIGRQVAIKTLTEGFSGQPEMLERFYREAQAGILQHPNIVIVYDLGDEDGVPFIVMEFVEGEPLDKLIASGRQLPLIDKLTIIEQVCSALGYAHQHGVIHRDIKPANVMVQSNPIHAKIVDFGIARVQGSSSGATSLTRTGNVIGSLHYIAPERLRGQPFDGRSDIFATGVMLYYLLTGQLPFTGEDIAVAQKLVHEQHRPLSAWLTNYPPALDGIIDRAMAKDPEQRYATAEVFAADLHSVCEELRKGQVEEMLTDAARLSGEEQFGRAREVLFQVVRIDPQNTAARQLLSSVQQNLARMQRTEQIRQLVAEAQEAIAAARFQEAMSALEQAIKLDPENPALLAQMEEAKEKKRRHEEIGALMSQADQLRERADYTGALQAVEKALTLDQQNSGIRKVFAELSQQAKVAAKQGQIREMLGKAKLEISSRHYTAAVEILREVAQIDPSQPEMESLMQTALSAQEQERRRRIIEQIQTEIENSLLAEDYDRATELIERAVEKLPTETSLLQLKTRIAQQARQERERKLIETAAAQAQETFTESPGEALLIVQRALQELPGAERLLALEESLRQRLKNAEKEEVRGRYLREAQQAIDHSQFDKAVEILESYQLETGDAEGVGEVLEFARKEQTEQQRRERVATVGAEARTLVQQERFEPAIALLETAAAELADPFLARLLADTRAQRQEAARKAEALLTRIARLRERGQIEEAIELLQGQPSASVDGSPFYALLAELRAQQTRKQALSQAAAAAAKAVEEGDYFAALEGLKSVQRAYGEDAEVRRAIAAIEARRAEVANKSLTDASEAARQALVEQNPEAALKALRAVGELVEFADAARQAEWRRLGAEAGKPQARRGTSTIPTLGGEEAAPPPRKLLLPALALVALLLAVVGGWFFLRGNKPAPAGPQANPAITPALPPPPPSGTLVISGNVDGVGVFVDGPIKGFTQADGSLQLPLDPGQHSIRLVKAGYGDDPPHTVTITVNTQTPLHYVLTRSANATAPVEMDAYLSIHSLPGARVNIDRALQGKADARGDLILPVKPGTRLLEIGLDGYQTYSQSFNIKAGERNNVAAMLTPIPAAPRPVTPAPAVPAAPPPQPVQILSLSASMQQIEQGQTTTLRWQTANAAEVSIDNGIGRVDNSGETTVRPSASTTYQLTARGNGGTQQRAVNIVVEAKYEKPAAPAASAPALKAVDESAQVQAVLNEFKSAWNAHSLPRLQAVWTGMQPPQAKALQNFFKDVPSARVDDNCPAAALSITGDTARWGCTEITTIASSGKQQSTSHGINFTFTRRSGGWTISDRR